MSLHHSLHQPPLETSCHTSPIPLLNNHPVCLICLWGSWCGAGAVTSTNRPNRIWKKSVDCATSIWNWTGYSRFLATNDPFIGYLRIWLNSKAVRDMTKTLKGTLAKSAMHGPLAQSWSIMHMYCDVQWLNWNDCPYHVTGSVRQFFSIADPWAATSQSHSSAHGVGHANIYPGRLQTMRAGRHKNTSCTVMPKQCGDKKPVYQIQATIAILANQVGQ